MTIDGIRTYSTWKDYQYIEVENRPIHIFDNLYSAADRERLYSFCSTRNFTTDGSDTARLEYKGDFNLYSNIIGKQLTDSGFLELENTKYLTELLTGYEIIQARVNLSTLHDRNRFHCDAAGGNDVRTILYYPNMEWNREWGGYTLFTNQQSHKLEYCSFYIPGRVILFDGTIPHCISSPSITAPTYRFSFVIQYFKSK